MHLQTADVVSSSAVLCHAGPSKSCVRDRNLSRYVSLHIVPGGCREGGGAKTVESPMSCSLVEQPGTV